MTVPTMNTLVALYLARDETRCLVDDFIARIEVGPFDTGVFFSQYVYIVSLPCSGMMPTSLR